MAYNNGFPATYQQYYPQYQYVQNQNQHNSIIWVQGEAGAKSYIVAPNSTVQLWDSESNVIYIKSADASGMPSMKILDYTIRNETQNQNNLVAQQIDMSNYVNKSDLNALNAKVDKLQALVDSLHSSMPISPKNEV